MNARFVALVAGVGCFFLALGTQGLLPLIEPASRTDKVTQVVRTDFGELKWMASVATDYTDQQQLGRQGLHPRGLLVLPFAVRAAGDRRDPALGPGQPGRRVRL